MHRTHRTQDIIFADGGRGVDRVDPFPGEVGDAIGAGGR